jgi:MFS family permease
VDSRSRWLCWLALCEIGTMLVFYNFATALPVLQKEWSLTNSQAGWIYSSYQIGYMLAVVYLASLTDTIHAKYIYILSAFWAGLTGVLFALLAGGFGSALVLRTLTGMGLAGTYMPGLRMVSERFSPHERGRAVGIYVAAFTFGASLSVFLTGYLVSAISWRWAFLVTSIGPLGGGVVALLRLGDVGEKKASPDRKVSFTQVLRHRPALIIILGYAAHMWEMFGMRGWMVAFLTACFLTAHYGFSKAVTLSAVISGLVNLVGAASNVVGGILSDRFGRTNTIITVMIGSSLISLVFGLTRTFPLWAVIVVSLLYGFMVTGESSVLSTGVTELALPGALGKTMALQSVVGFGAASLSPVAFGFILDITNPLDALSRYGYFPNWGWAFFILGLGGLIGPAFIWAMRKDVS